MRSATIERPVINIFQLNSLFPMKKPFSCFANKSKKFGNSITSKWQHQIRQEKKIHYKCMYVFKAQGDRMSL
jgi:hypothetical protein